MRTRLFIAPLELFVQVIIHDSCMRYEGCLAPCRTLQLTHTLTHPPMLMIHLCRPLHRWLRHLWLYAQVEAACIEAAELDLAARTLTVWLEDPLREHGTASGRALVTAQTSAQLAAGGGREAHNNHLNRSNSRDSRPKGDEQGAAAVAGGEAGEGGGEDGEDVVVRCRVGGGSCAGAGAAGLGPGSYSVALHPEGGETTFQLDVR
jgi:hypothetical protein